MKSDILVLVNGFRRIGAHKNLLRPACFTGRKDLWKRCFSLEWKSERLMHHDCGDGKGDTSELD